jgi:hypothetical protein
MKSGLLVIFGDASLHEGNLGSFTENLVYLGILILAVIVILLFIRRLTKGKK